MTTSSITPEDAFVRRSVQALAPETPRPRGSIGFDLSGDGGGNADKVNGLLKHGQPYNRLVMADLGSPLTKSGRGRGGLAWSSRSRSADADAPRTLSSFRRRLPASRLRIALRSSFSTSTGRPRPALGISSTTSATASMRVIRCILPRLAMTLAASRIQDSGVFGASRSEAATTSKPVSYTHLTLPTKA